LAVEDGLDVEIVGAVGVDALATGGTETRNGAVGEPMAILARGCSGESARLLLSTLL